MCAFRSPQQGAPRRAELIDNDRGDQRGPGDLLIGTRGITDENGEAMGAIHWVSTTLDPDTSHVATVMVLPDGEIYYQTRVGGIGGSSNVDNDSVQFDRSNGVIVGGTGAYTFARGSIELFLEEDGKVYRVNVRCD